MDEEQRSLLIGSSSHYPSPQGFELRYGTRGFVGDASVLRSAAFRLGILAALRSIKSKSVTGVMIGGNVGETRLRIVDPDGGALIADWASFADSVANADHPDEFVALIEEFVKKENISFDVGEPSEVLLGRDSRASGEPLLEAAEQGITSIGGAIFFDMGILTTPQLHWLVCARNKGIKASEHDYFQQLSCNYRCLVDLSPEEFKTNNADESLIVDGACGVGGEKFETLNNLCDGLAIEVRNTSKSIAVTQGVGVDFIQVQKSLPAGFGPNDVGFRCASLDGDAERLLYFYISPSHRGIEIVDGDKILFLYTLFIQEQLSVLQEVEGTEEDRHYHACLGILQSPHTNGASTNYLKSLGLNIVIMPNGTGSLHAEVSKYDIGICCEPDGRGSILFSESYISWLEAKNNEFLPIKGSRKQRAVSRLLAISRLISLTVTDALVGLLLVEAILRYKGWSVQKWNELYYDLASSQHNVVELAEKTTVAPAHTETTAAGKSGTGENAESPIVPDEAKPQVNASHWCQESKHITMDSSGSQVHQSTDHVAQATQRPDVDAFAELQESREPGTIHIESYKNEIKMHTGLPEEVEKRQESGTMCLHTDETDHEKPEATIEEEESQGVCINYIQSDGVALPLVSFSKKSLGEERRCQLDAELLVRSDPNRGISEDTCPSQLPEAGGVVIDEGIKVEKGEADDDAWVFFSDGKGDCFDAGSVMMADAKVHHAQFATGEPSIDVAGCSDPKASGVPVSAGSENDLLVLAVQTEIAGLASDSEPACEIESESQKSSSDRFSSSVAHDEKLESKAQEGSVHDFLLPSDKAEMAGVTSDSGPACETESELVGSAAVYDVKLESEAQNGLVRDSFVSADKAEIAGVPIDSGPACETEYESQKSSDYKCSSDVAHDDKLLFKDQNVLFHASNGSNGLVGVTSLDDVSPSCSEGNSNNLPLESGEALSAPSTVCSAEETGGASSAEFASCCSIPQPEVNGNVVEVASCDHVANLEVETQNIKVDSGLFVSADKAEIAGVGVDSETACETESEAQESSGDRCSSGAAHDDKLLSNGQNVLVHASNWSSGLVDGASLDDVSPSCSEGDNNNLPLDSGEAMCVPSSVCTAEETGDASALEYASCCTRPQPEVNGNVVEVASPDHVANSEVETQNIKIDSDSGTRVSFSSSELNGVEAPVETLKSLSIPDSVKTEEASCTNGSVETKSQSLFHSSVNGSLVRLVNNDNEVDDGAFDAENGSAGNLPVDKAILLVPDAVQADTHGVDVTPSTRHESKVNGVIIELNNIQVAESDVDSQNDPFDVEDQSESTHDEVEGTPSPDTIETAEAEGVKGLESVLDTQPLFQMNDNSALSAPIHLVDAQETKIITCADSSPPQETKIITCADSSPPQFQGSSVYADLFHSHDILMESKAVDASFNGDGCLNCVGDNVSLNTKISFGSFDCDEFVSRMGPQSEQILGNTFCTGRRDLPCNDSDSFAPRKSGGNSSDLSEHNVEYVPFTGAGKGSTSSLEGGAAEIFDGENASAETAKPLFRYLIKVPKYDDEKLNEQIQLAQSQLEERTRSRDAILVDYRKKKEICQELKATQQAAVQEERAARDLVRAKRKEVDSAQSLVNVAKDAMTIEDLDNKVASMEHTIQHETVSLNEEKKLIREIKQSKQLREQLVAATYKQGVQQALDQRDTNGERLKVLRKEMDILKGKLSKAEQGVSIAMKSFDCERRLLNELYDQYKSSDAVRQEAFFNLQNLRKQWSEKNKYFWSFKDDHRLANKFAAAADKVSLQSLCVNQVETVMKLWNTDNDFRRDYIRCNMQSTLRRLGTPDGRSLGPDEEAPSLPPMVSGRRITALVKDKKQATPAAVQRELVVEPRQKVDTRSNGKSLANVAEQKKQNVVRNKSNKPSQPKNEVADTSKAADIQEDKEELKIRKEEEELARKAEEQRKKEAENLRETRRLEEKAKALEALERKRRVAEKAQARAEYKAKKEAEEKEKERERKARKKEKKNKKGVVVEDGAEATETAAATAGSEVCFDAKTQDRSTKRAPPKRQYTKQNKLKSIPAPPPPLRNRGRRRMMQQWWMWVAAAIVAVLVLFFIGNIDVSAIFSFLH